MDANGAQFQLVQVILVSSTASSQHVFPAELSSVGLMGVVSVYMEATLLYKSVLLGDTV